MHSLWELPIAISSLILNTGDSTGLLKIYGMSIFYQNIQIQGGTELKNLTEFGHTKKTSPLLLNLDF